MTWYEIVISSAGVLGGLELIKWIVNVIFNRKNNARILDAEADASEFHILQEEIQFLQQQLRDAEVRHSEQTTLLRTIQQERLEVEKDKSVMEVEYLKLVSKLELDIEKKRCDDIMCPFRLPPNAHTPATSISKDSYFSGRGTND